MVNNPLQKRGYGIYHWSEKKRGKLGLGKPEPIDPSIHRPHRKDLMKTVLCKNKRDPFTPTIHTNPVAIAMDLPQVVRKGSLIPVRPRPTLPSNYLHFLQEYHSFLPELKEHDLETWMDEEIAKEKALGMTFSQNVIEEYGLPPLRHRQGIFTQEVEGVQSYNYSTVKQFSSKDDRNLRRELIRRQRAMVDIKAAWYRNVVETNNASNITFKASETFSTRNVPFMLQLLKTVEAAEEEALLFLSPGVKEDKLENKPTIQVIPTTPTSSSQGRGQSATTGFGKKPKFIPLSRIVATWNEEPTEETKEEENVDVGIVPVKEDAEAPLEKKLQSSSKQGPSPQPPSSTPKSSKDLPPAVLSKETRNLLAKFAKESSEKETAELKGTIKNVITGSKALTESFQSGSLSQTLLPGGMVMESKRSRRLRYRDKNAVMQSDLVKATYEEITCDITRFVAPSSQAPSDANEEMGEEEGSIEGKGQTIDNPLADAEFNISEHSESDEEHDSGMLFTIHVESNLTPDATESSLKSKIPSTPSRKKQGDNLFSKIISIAKHLTSTQEPKPKKPMSPYLKLPNQEEVSVHYLNRFLQSPLVSITSKAYLKSAPDLYMMALEFLEHALNDGYTPLRFEAAQLFCQLFPKSVKLETLNTLINTLNDMMDMGEKEECWCAIKGLCKLGRISAQVLNYLFEGLGDMDRTISKEGLEVLCSLDNTHRYLVFDSMEELRDHPNWKVREGIILLIEKVLERGLAMKEEKLAIEGSAPENDAIDALMQFLPTENKDDQGQFPPRRESLTSAMASTIIQSKTTTRLTSAVKSGKLLYLRESEDAAHFERLLEILYGYMWNDWSEGVREQAAKTLSAVKQGGSIFRMIQSQLTHELPAKRIEALKTIEWLQVITEDVIPVFAHCFSDPYKSVVFEACKVACILKSNHPKIVVALLSKFDDLDWKIRCYAIKALGSSQSTDPRVSDITMWFLLHETHPAVLVEACAAARSLQPPLCFDKEKLLEALLNLKENSHPSVQKAAETTFKHFFDFSVSSAVSTGDSKGNHILTPMPAAPPEAETDALSISVLKTEPKSTLRKLNSSLNENLLKKLAAESREAKRLDSQWLQHALISFDKNKHHEDQHHQFISKYKHLVKKTPFPIHKKSNQAQIEQQSSSIAMTLPSISSINNTLRGTSQLNKLADQLEVQIVTAIKGLTTKENILQQVFSIESEKYKQALQETHHPRKQSHKGRRKATIGMEQNAKTRR